MISVPIPGLMTEEQVRYFVLDVLKARSHTARQWLEGRLPYGTWINREVSYYFRHQEALVDDIDDMICIRPPVSLRDI